MWGILNLTRTELANKLDSNVAQVACMTADMFYSMKLSGVSVNLLCQDGEQTTRVTIFADIRVILADIPALKDCLHCKGHGAHKCCPLCINACNHKQVNPYHLQSAFFKTITCFDWATFEKHTDQSLIDTMQRITNYHDQRLANRLTQEKYEEYERIHGWSWSYFNVITNERMRVRVASCVMYDWAHVYVNDGIADIEMGQCMKALHLSMPRTSYTECGQYCDSFTFPKSRGSPTHVFNDASNRNNLKKEAFTSSASEFLTLAPIVYRYLKKVALPRNQSVPQVMSLIACLDVVMIWMAVQVGCVTPLKLNEKILAQLVLYKAAYGDDGVRPKQHYALHLGHMLERFGFLLSTFTHERKHRLVKRYTRDRCKLQNWERNALEEVTCHQIWELSLPFFMESSTCAPRGEMRDRLRHLLPHIPVEFLDMHSSVKCIGGVTFRGDVVVFKWDNALHVGELVLTVSVKSEQPVNIYCWVVLWDCGLLSSKPGFFDSEADHAYWLPFSISSDKTLLLPLSAVLGPLTYRLADDRSTALVHIPYEFRSK